MFLQMCHTLLSIEECEAILKLPEQQLKTLVKAAAIVEKTNQPKLKRRILGKLHKLQVALQIKDAEETLKNLNSLGELSSDSEEDEDIQEQTPNIGDFIDLDALTGL